MKKLLLTLLTAWLCGLMTWAEDNDLYRIVPGHDYYIWNTYYDRPLQLSPVKLALLFLCLVIFLNFLRPASRHDSRGRQINFAPHGALPLHT